MELFEARRAKFFAGKVAKGHKVANFRQACLQKQQEGSGQSVPKMGFSDLILEKDGRCFRNLSIFPCPSPPRPRLRREALSGSGSGPHPSRPVDRTGKLLS